MKQPKTRTIVIDRVSILTGDQLLVRDTWQTEEDLQKVRRAMSDSIVASTDPLDTALRNYAQLTGTKQPLHSLTFSPEHPASGNVWHHGGEFDIAVKGMPEYIIDHCDLTENELESLMIQFHAMSANGDYIIALATGRLSRDINTLDELELNEKLSFDGFTRLRVDVASDTRRLIRDAQGKGIHPYLVTGQHPTISLHLGRQLGLARAADEVLDARRLATMTDADILDALREVSVIARADQSQKRHIMALLEKIDDTTVRINTLQDLHRAIG